MAATSVLKNGQWKLRVMFKGNNKSWGETYFLKLTSLVATAAIAAGNSLTLARRLILAGGFKVDWAIVSKMDTKRDRRTVQPLPLSGFNLDTEAGPPIALEVCNNVQSCLNVEYETVDGKWNTRQLRGIRDTWISGHAAAFVPTTPGALTDADFVAGKTKEVALGNFLGAVQQYSAWFTPDPDVPGNILTDAWANFNLIGVGSRDTGCSWRNGRGRKKALTTP